MKNSDREVLLGFIDRAMETARHFAGGLTGAGNDLELQSRLSGHLESLSSELPGPSCRAFACEIASLARNLTARESVAFLGPEGTFSETALISYFGSAVEKMSCATIPAVFRLVERGLARFGIVPVENSTEGSVTYTMDELIETPLSVIGEHYVRISIALLSRAASLDAISRVYTHSQPLAQSKDWLKTNLPGVEIIETDSTARAVQLASEDSTSGAIGSERASATYAIDVLARGIEDLRQNATRFFILHDTFALPTGRDKTSLVLSVKDRPGALLGILRPFEEQGINMTRIESRPDKKKMWAYNFFIDISGHRDDDQVKKALMAIEPHTVFVKILGSYPSADRVLPSEV